MTHGRSLTSVAQTLVLRYIEGCQDLDSRQGLSLIWGVSDFVSDWDHLSGHSPLKHAFTLEFGG